MPCSYSNIKPPSVKIKFAIFTCLESRMPKSASSPISKRFDYDSLDSADAVFVQQQTSEIRGLMKRTAEDIVDIGQRLIEVKKRLKHGRFGTWLTAEFGWNQKTAERFMNVAESFQSKFDSLSIFDLAPSALYILAAPSTPAEAREEAIARAQSGQSITYTAAKNLKQKYSPPKHQPENPQPSLQQTSSQEAKPPVAQPARESQLSQVKQPSPEPEGTSASNPPTETVSTPQAATTPTSITSSQATFTSPAEPTLTKSPSAAPSAPSSYALPEQQTPLNVVKAQVSSLSAPTFPWQRATDPVQPRLEIMAIRPKEADPVVSVEDEVETVASLQRSMPRFVQPGTWWQFGEQHLLYCGDPASPRFRERLPDKIALSLAFPPTPAWQLSSLSSDLRSSLTLFTRYQEDQDFQLFREMIERSLLLYTEGGDAVIFSFLPEPSLLLVAHELQCRWFCAEPAAARCEAAIAAWKGKGFRAEKVSGLRF